jgi:hypothetical protein
LRAETENAVALVFAREDVEGLVWNVALLKGELAEARQAREVAEETIWSLSDMATDGARWLVVSERVHREQFEELSLLWTQGSELCLAIVGPS